MTNQKTKAKSGMEGRASRTVRSAKRHLIKEATRKLRRRDDRFVVQED